MYHSLVEGAPYHANYTTPNAYLHRTQVQYHVQVNLHTASAHNTRFTLLEVR
jgi:hypothetical protein